MDEHRAGALSPAAQISADAVSLLREYTGRGPTRARTTISRDAVLVLMGDTLTKGERSLVEAGDAERVLDVRRAVQSAMREEIVAMVEKHTQRRVMAFMSENHIDPDLAAEVFVLEPEQGPAAGTPHPDG